MKVIYWSDYACPFCYIGETRMKKAIAELPELGEVELEMKSFELDPSAPDSIEGDPKELLAHKYGTSIEQAEQQMEAISQMGRAEGLQMNFSSVKSGNSMTAHRLTKLAQSKHDRALTDKLIEALFKSYFEKNENLADHAVLLRIASECGLDGNEVKDMLASDKYRDEVLKDEREAAGNGIHAVPFFIIGKYGISGAQSMDVMKQALTRTLEEEKTEGLSCDADGCKLK